MNENEIFQALLQKQKAHTSSEYLKKKKATNLLKSSTNRSNDQNTWLR